MTPGRTDKEYYEDNKEKFSQKSKEYFELNKDQIITYRNNIDSLIEKYFAKNRKGNIFVNVVVDTLLLINLVT